MTPALAAHDVSDSDLADPVPVPNARRSHAIGTCSLCRRSTLEELIDAGGDVGLVHRSCFATWDQLQEALEQTLVRSCTAPHHADGSADLDLEPVCLHLPGARSTSPRSRRTTITPPEGLPALACAAP